MSLIVNAMRNLAMALVVVALLVLAFFVGPRTLAIFDADYRQATEEFVPARTELVGRRLDLESDYLDRKKDLVDIGAKIDTVRPRLKDNKDPDLQADLESLIDLERIIEEQMLDLDKSIKRADNDIADLGRVIERTYGYADNVYLVVRAIALGALGALLYTTINFLSRRRWRDLFADGNLERAVAAALVGAIAAVVVFAVFHTRQVSIFSAGAEAAAGRPDFWRVTVFCFGAGAMAGAIYRRSAPHVDRLLAPAEPRNDKSPSPSDQDAAPADEPPADDTANIVEPRA
jgi:hypothetical protein